MMRRLFSQTAQRIVNIYPSSSKTTNQKRKRNPSPNEPRRKEKQSLRVYLPVIEHVDKAETSMIPTKSDDENIKRNSTFINKRKDSHGTKKAMVMQTGLMAHKSRNS